MRRIVRSSLCALVCVILTGVAQGADWMDLDGGGPARAPDVRLVESRGDVAVLEFRLPGYYAETVEIDGRPHVKLAVPGCVPLLVKGLPELPFLARSVALPDHGRARLEILETEYKDLPSAPVAPSKGDLPRSVDPAGVPYEFAPLYAEGGVYPAAAAALGRPYILRDHRGVAVRIHPFQYDAGRGVLRVLHRVRVAVAVSDEPGINEKVRAASAQPDPQFRRVYDRHFLNLGADKYTAIARPGPMLIVCYDAFASAMAPFVEWKRQRGLAVEMIPVSSVGGTAAGIQGAITTRYESPAGLTYVVLVGDIAQVPTNPGTVEASADSDPRYAMVEGGDSYPDLFVSRISAQTVDQVQSQVAKFVRYERDPDAGGDWYHLATGIASNESGGTGLYDYERMDLLRDDLLAYTFTGVDQIYQGMGGSTAGITAALNAGRSLVNYIGHGSGTAWTSVYFGTTDVHALANGWMHPWIVDVSCSNGDFSTSECFAEAWLRAGSPAQPTGAVATYSASTLASWVPPCVMQAEVIDLLVAETENSLGALYFSGGMAALDAYPAPDTEGRKLIEQYNIFGDCSLVVRTDTPAAIAASHAAAIPLMAPTFTVDVPGLAGATACLYRDGVVHGTAVTDASGHAEIALGVPVDSVGEVTLTVTAYNHAPYIATVPAVVPASVTLVPDSVPVGITTAVTVTVEDSLGLGMPDVTVWIEGFGVSGLEEITDAGGQAVFDVTPQYGEVLSVRGRESGAAYDLFAVELPVTGAAPLTGPVISAHVAAIGLHGALTPHLEGSVLGSAGEMGLTLILTGCGVDTSAVDPGTKVQILATPDATGTIQATLLRPGNGIHQVAIPVVPAYGTLGGTVVEAADGTTPVAGARIRAYAAGSDTTGAPPLFDVASDGAGAYAAPDSLPVGDYDVYTSRFGYLPDAATIALMYGPNTHDVALATAPSGALSGVVTSAADGEPVAADLKIYRQDTGELYAETASDPVTGAYTAGPLPYSGYQVRADAYHFLPRTLDVAVDAPTVVQDFVLDPTAGDLLVVDDAAKRAGDHPPKFGHDGEIVAESYPAKPARSAAEMVAELQALGYDVTLETSTVTDPATWGGYDLLIVTGSNSNTPLDDATLRAAIESHVLGGGRLLIEGGEVGYRAMSYPGYPSFAANVLHCTDWNHDSSGNVTITAPAHHVASVPNTVVGPITLAYSGYGDADAVVAAAGTTQVGSWTSYPSDASIVAFDPNPAPEGGQIVFFAFNYGALDPAVRPDLLQNAVNWLLTPEVGSCAASGRAVMQGETDNAGILVEAVPGGGSVLTGADGTFAFPGLFPGTYQLIASKAGWATVVTGLTLAEGESVEGLYLELRPIASSEFCASPGLAIPDNNPTGATSTLEVGLVKEIAGLEVFVDITHTYIGDLTVDLTSPAGTVIRLHNRTGGTTEDIYGWYPQDLDPHEDLDACLGELCNGTWRLKVTDLAGADVGTLNTWCLRISYAVAVSGVEDDERALPRAVALDGNYPNPFNPATRIVWALPRAMEVDLAVFDMRGRRIATLASGPLPAGRHEATWRGADDLGRPVATGLYFYRLRTADGNLTRKMLLMK